MNIINRFTLRTLCKNKVRTLVTIIGIALSIAMFTGVISLVVSFQQYLVNIEVASEGAWEGGLDSISAKTVEKVKKSKEISGSTTVANLGYAYEKQSEDESKPYLFVAGLSKDFENYSVVNMVEGRMPKNSSEVVIPKHLLNNSQIAYQVGDTLDLELGKRVVTEGEGKGLPVGGQGVPVLQGSEQENLTGFTHRTFRIVGICERVTFESGTAPGYTLLTIDEGKKAATYNMFMTFQDPTRAKKVLVKFLKSEPEDSFADYSVHEDLLRLRGKSTSNVFNKILYQMGSILLGIIFLGSISLIYNAFSISVSERTKQFGLLKSVGATKKQIRNSVFFEVFALSIIGIPLGMLAGFGGIAVTLHFVQGLLGPMLNTSSVEPLRLVVTGVSIVCPIVIGLFTVLVSAWIPARRAVKLPAIQSLRQSTEIKIRGKKVKTSRLVYKLFHFEGMLASKNFKRNRRKYRATVLSLFMSIVLFVAAASFSNYMQASVDSVESNEQYDVSCVVSDKNCKDKTTEGIGKDLCQVAAVKECAYVKSNLFAELRLPVDQFDEEYLEHVTNTMDQTTQNEIKKEGVQEQETVVYFLEDSVFEAYLEENHLDKKKYMNSKKPCALVWDRAVLFESDGVFSSHILKKAGYQGQVTLREYNDDDEVSASVPLDVTFGSICQGKVPLGVDDMSYGALTLVLPYRYLEEYNLQEKLPDSLDKTTYKIRSSDHKKTVTELTEYFSDRNRFGNFASDHIFDRAEMQEVNEAMLLIIDIFAYGFIILITLISLANVFNTISTNIALRRQEFAMLKSVGMTQKGFHRMMNYECLLFGFKSLLYGLPVSLLLNELMVRVLGGGINMPRIIPWREICIACVSVFGVVFITMLYSFGKIRKDNPIEALRNENL